MAPQNPLPIHGNEKTMNLNSLILTNIQSSPYFKVNLYELKTYHEVIDEIYYKVEHLEPWEKGSRKTAGQTGMCGGVRGVGAGGIVSSAFCLLYKLFTLRLTHKQVVGLITHQDSPYIRGLGFMYIRYTQHPGKLWEWYKDYLEDEEMDSHLPISLFQSAIHRLLSIDVSFSWEEGAVELDVKAGGGHIMTIGEMARQWMSKLEWYSTLFPRIPVPIQKQIEHSLSEYDRQNPQQAVEPQVVPEHIPDGDVHFGEAERIARLRKSTSPTGSGGASASQTASPESQTRQRDRDRQIREERNARIAELEAEDRRIARERETRREKDDRERDHDRRRDEKRRDERDDDRGKSDRGKSDRKDERSSRDDDRGRSGRDAADRDRERERERDRDRDHKHSHKERREKHKHHRSSSKERHHKDHHRSRDHDKKNRDKKRSHSRERDSGRSGDARRSRSRDRSHKHHSHSRSDRESSFERALRRERERQDRQRTKNGSY